MDKQKGLNILGLAPSATCTDARTAFRRLAKTWHPDRFAKDPLKAKIAEEKMKQVNEAFHFLLPLLPKTDAGKNLGKNPADSIHACDACGPTRCRGKSSHGFFSALAAVLKKHCNGRKRADIQGTGSAGKAHKPAPHCRAGTAGRRGKPEFETVFQNVVHHNQAGAKPRLHPETRVPGCYANYRKYFDSALARRRNIGRLHNRSAGPVEEISPVSPVSPVK